ncbi:hypothetical protein Sjap_010203 [Stephania japonica]|uniref:Magnesium transporter n=1 Tax=Stephania japonica TaxID=461633 RepID=A0AAP0P6X3_9MAGN
MSSSSTTRPLRAHYKPGSATPEEDSTEMARAAAAASGLRKKGVWVRTWLLLDSTGQAQLIEAGKYSIMRRTGLPARDLRILDPLLSYPSTVLGREKAIVINLEHIKSIITAQEVLLLNSRDPSVSPFVEELQRRISHLHHARRTSQEFDGDHQLMSPGGGEDCSGGEGPRVLPFEFVALEACLEAACSSLDTEVREIVELDLGLAKTLEQEAHPALDKLTSKISTLNLERVRQIKSRLVAITGRVQKVRDELEHLLDDDEDMAEMYLTEKMQQHLDQSSSFSSFNGREDMDDGMLQAEVDDRLPTETSSEANDVSNTYEGDPENFVIQEHLLGMHNVVGRDSHGTRTSTTHSAISKLLDVEELEMLLEAYFVQIDGTLNKLSTLREYVDDTEDYINIMLDDKQNHLLQMGVMLTTATLVMSAYVVVCGIFGMNVTIELFDKQKSGMREFLWTVGGSATGTVFLYVIAIAWCKHKRLLE